MRFAVLGPLLVGAETGPVALASTKQRVALAQLITAGGRSVRPDVLIDELWEGIPPAGARKALSWHILRLRDALGNRELIKWDGKGYRLDDPAGWVDAEHFERLKRDGEACLESDPHTASQLLTEALELWRGAAYEGLCDFGQLHAEANRLEELRFAATEQRCEAELALGRHSWLIPELTTLVSAQPFRETLRAHLMLALYRAGRQSDALQVFREGREVMSREMGLRPGPGLCELERQILHADPALAAAASPAPPPKVAVTPAQLPSGITTFTARSSELDALLHMSRQAEDSPNPVVSCISGMAGSGKTTLALHAAHRLAAQFTDGQLFLDLHGFSESASPVGPDHALERLLRGLGVPDDEIPPTTDEKAVLWRSYASTRRLLIVLDDAASDEQVRALLPGGAGHIVLVTSRQRLLVADDTRLIELEPLEHDDAVALFHRILGELADDTEVGTLHEIIDLCGRLPLALQVVASRLRSHPHWTVQDIARRLSQQQRLLTELRIGDRSVATAFHFSYQQLDTAQRRVFRLIGLTTGPDFDPHAAAALTGLTVDQVEVILEQLVEAHLLEARPGHRFLPHSLIRAFARERCYEEDDESTRASALRRLHGWYSTSARAAAILMRRHRDVLPAYAADQELPVVSFEDRAAASRWFDQEQHNLYDLLTEADSQHNDALVYSLADAMRCYFFIRGAHSKWVRVSEAGLRAAQRAAAPAAEGSMHYALGQAAALSGNYEPAIGHYQQALKFTRDADWKRRDVEVLLSLGAVHLQRTRPGPAAEYCLQALEFNTEDIGPLYSDVVHILGASLWQRGNLAEALDRLREAVDTNRRDGLDTLYDLFGTLALTLADHGELTEAESCAAQALRLSREQDIHHGEASAWSNLSSIYTEMGDVARAVSSAERELELARQHTMRTHEAYALAALAWARLDENPTAARDVALEALGLEAQLCTNIVELDARRCLAAALLALHEPDAALRHIESVLELAQDHQLRIHEGQSLTTLAAIRLERDEPELARTALSRALESQQATGHRRGEARSQLLAERICASDGEFETARQHATRARELFEATGGRYLSGREALAP